MSTLQTLSVVVIHQLDTGTCFAARTDGVEGGVFISARLSKDKRLSIGDAFNCIVMPNPQYSERSPWAAVRILANRDLDQPDLPMEYPTTHQETPPVQQETSASVRERVQDVLDEGGVWSTATMFAELFPAETRTGNLQAYDSVAKALRAVFDADECAKVQLWGSHKQSRPSKEWFTAYPTDLDVREKE